MVESFNGSGRVGNVQTLTPSSPSQFSCISFFFFFFFCSPTACCRASFIKGILRPAKNSIPVNKNSRFTLSGQAAFDLSCARSDMHSYSESDCNKITVWEGRSSRPQCTVITRVFSGLSTYNKVYT